MSDFGVLLEKAIVGVVLGGFVAIFYYIFKKPTVRQRRDPSYDSIRQKRTTQPSVKEKPISQPIVQETKTEKLQTFQPVIDQKKTNEKNIAHSETEGRSLRVIIGDIEGRRGKIVEFQAEDGSQLTLQTPWLTFREMLGYTRLTVEEFEDLSKGHVLAHGGVPNHPVYHVDVIDKWIRIKRD